MCLLNSSAFKCDSQFSAVSCICDEGFQHPLCISELKLVISAAVHTWVYHTSNMCTKMFHTPTPLAPDPLAPPHQYLAPHTPMRCVQINDCM